VLVIAVCWTVGFTLGRLGVGPSVQTEALPPITIRERETAPPTETTSPAESVPVTGTAPPAETAPILPAPPILPGNP